MNRREFIRGPAATGLAAAAVASLPLDALAFPSPIFKRGRAGCVLRSEDGGASWRRVLDLGPDCRVLEIRQHAGHVSCSVANGRREFRLFTRDGRRWATHLQAVPRRRVARRPEHGRGSRNDLPAARV